MFSTHKQLYFVFQHEGEPYFLDSTLQLRLDDWLRLSLRRSGYRYTYFLDAVGSQMKLTILDADSYHQYYARSLWFKPDFQGQVCVDLDQERAVQWLTKELGRRNGESAFVFRMEAFARLFQPDYPSKARLLDRLIQRLHNCRDALVLVGPMEMMEEVLSLYTAPGSVLAYVDRETGQSLCRSARELLLDRDNLCFFDRLREKLDDQFLELGTFTFDGLKTLMGNVRFARDEAWDEGTLLDYTNFLYFWTYKPKLRAYCQGLFSSLKQPITYAALFRCLCDNGIAAMEERMQRLRRSARNKNESERLIDILVHQFGPLPKDYPSQESHVVFAEPELSALAELPWPEWAYRKGASPFQIWEPAEREWDVMKRSLLKARNRPFPRTRIRWIDKFVVRMKRAENRGDHWTVRRTVNVLLYCGNNLYTEGEFDQYCQGCERYLTVSEGYFDKYREYLRIKPSGTDAVAAVQGQLYSYGIALESADAEYQTVSEISGIDLTDTLQTLLESVQPTPDHSADADMDSETASRILEARANRR
ncbi:MAG: hypothetical protein LIO70_02330 [Clostridiales bacterium]|nr:hypothetical protein [Clostridiales bacterium]